MATRAPSSPPPFTVKELRASIPAHCFNRSLAKSFGVLARDIIFTLLLGYASTKIDALNAPQPVLALLWGLYWVAQGCVCTGVWVVAHECGHGAFSASPTVNDAVGFIFHSLLLVPYYSWKHSHRRHHSNTGSTTKDEVFVPVLRGAVDYPGPPLHRFALYRLLHLLFAFTVGWPAYLLFNLSGRAYPGRWANHFDPYSPIFSSRERLEIVASDLGLAAVLTGLYAASQAWGTTWLLKTYVAPYLIVNFWLVMITLLQHTHPALPHYDDNEWEWMLGALSTVDRSYGWILDTTFHHIADTHVIHHLFSQMPHYHAQEATKAIKPVLGSYYQRDERNIFKALWQDFEKCGHAAPDTKDSGVYWFRLPYTPNKDAKAA